MRSQSQKDVSGRLGHLSNREAADVLSEAVEDTCRGVVLAHLSEKNNTRELARRCTVAALANRAGRDIDLRIASTDAPTAPVCL